MIFYYETYYDTNMFWTLEVKLSCMTHIQSFFITRDTYIWLQMMSPFFSFILFSLLPLKILARYLSLQSWCLQLLRLMKRGHYVRLRSLFDIKWILEDEHIILAGFEYYGVPIKRGDLNISLSKTRYLFPMQFVG